MLQVNISNSIDNIIYCEYMEKNSDNEKLKNDVETDKTTITP